MMMGQQMAGQMSQTMFGNGQQAQASQAAAPASENASAGGWKFCPECGASRPVEDSWTCSCGTVNKGKFCMNCGAKKPEKKMQYRCSRCGWEPADPENPPKFCPECGDPFGPEDAV